LSCDLKLPLDNPQDVQLCALTIQGKEETEKENQEVTQPEQRPHQKQSGQETYKKKGNNRNNNQIAVQGMKGLNNLGNTCFFTQQYQK